MADFVELQLEAGATFSAEITVQTDSGDGKDLSDYTVRSQFRKSYYSTTATDFVINILDAPAGLIEMSLPASTTSNVRPGRYVYDVEIEDSSNTVTRIFEGIVTVLPGVTR